MRIAWLNDSLHVLLQTGSIERMRTIRYILLGICVALAFGCSGGAPSTEKPTGQIDGQAKDLSSAKPTTANDKFNRYNAPD
jgi:hypothetical protein